MRSAHPPRTHVNDGMTYVRLSTCATLQRSGMGCRPPTATDSIAETKSQRTSGKHSDHAIVMTRFTSTVSHSYCFYANRLVYNNYRMGKVLFDVRSILMNVIPNLLPLYHNEIHSPRLTTNCLHDVRACVRGGWSLTDSRGG